MKKNIFFFFIFNLYLTLTSCSTTDPILEPDLKLELKDVSCTEAWLQLTSTNLQISNNISLLVNGTVKKTFALNTQDSLLYIDSLLPNQTYKILATMQQSNNASNELSVTTMDTTSHNFTWQTFTFGEHSSSSLYDVAIINENDIWAVGEIYMNDSLGNPDPNLYNLIKWDGVIWRPERVYYKDNQGQSFLAPLKAIFAFSENNVMLGSDIIFHWDGNKYNSIVLPEVIFNHWINKIWGESTNDLFIVGSLGSVAHYLNGNWSKIESVTDLEIQDIWAGNNLENAQQEIFCIASDKYELIDKKVYEIKNNNAIEISNEGLPWSLSSVWFKSKYKCYIVGDGIFTKDLSSANSWQDITQGITPYYTHAIRGNGQNDIVVGGSFGELLHFNGLNWYCYKGRELPDFIGNYFAVGIKGNVICSVGQATTNSNAAIIALGIK